MMTKKERKPVVIPTASMPDIIFMLLIFFMVCTQFKEFRGLPVRLPSAENASKIDGKRNNSFCYVDINNRISVDDKLLDNKELVQIMYLKRTQNPRVIVNLKIDENVKNGFLNDIYKSLQEADARRIVYQAKSK
jgi:biopolymer transport protein ExbD